MPSLPTFKNYTDLEIAPTQANFPFINHLWLCEETSGLILSDEVGGSHITLNAGTAPEFGVGYYGGKYVFPNCGTNLGTFAAALEDITGPCIVFAVLNTPNAGPTLGLSTGARLQLGATQPITSDTDTGTSVNGAAWAAVAMTPGLRANIISTWNNASGQLSYCTNLGITDTDGISAAGSTSAVAGIDYSGGTPAFTCSATCTELYMMGIFEFAAAIPADYRTALAWMGRQAVIGNKAVYPGWYKYAG